MTRRPPRIPGTASRPRVLFVLPPIPDDAPDDVKDGLAIRNAASVRGVCPSCGATPELYRDGLGILHAVFQHEPDCGALLDEGTAA